MVVDLVAQFNVAGSPTNEEFQTFLDQLGQDDADPENAGNLGTIIMDPNCDPLVCVLREGD